MLSTLPIAPTLAMAQWMIALMVVGFLFMCVLLILIILIQKPQGGGLSGAFGSGAAQGSGQTVFGARTGDALTIGTISVFVLYLAVAIGLNYAIRPAGPVNAAPTAAATQPEGTAPAPEEAITTTNPAMPFEPAPIRESEPQP
jgi:preprotein translocase subunit SecG